MAAEDPRVQAQAIRTTSTTNGTSTFNPYTDPNITKRNVSSVADTVFPAKTTTNQEGVREFYASDRNPELSAEVPGANASVEPLPDTTNIYPVETVDGFLRNKDPYRSGGMVGQDFFKPAGEQ